MAAPPKRFGPRRCGERPWDLWVAEIGRAAPARDPRRPPQRAPSTRLRRSSMPLYGRAPAVDPLLAVLCDFCGEVVKCCAARRHLQERHALRDPQPPPAPARSLPRPRARPPPDAPFKQEPTAVELEPATVTLTVTTNEPSVGEEPAAAAPPPPAEPARAAEPDGGEADAAEFARPPPKRPKKRRSSSKPKYAAREYDPNRHCGVVAGDGAKPCTRSLTCKSHALSLRRTVEGRTKPFDALLAEHRAAKAVAEASTRPAETATPIVAPPPPPPPPSAPPRLPEFRPTEVHWYSTGPKPLAACTFSTCRLGNALLLSKRLAAVRSNFKSTVMRSRAKSPGGGFERGATTRCAPPELRKLVVSCATFSASNSNRDRPNGRSFCDDRDYDERARLGDATMEPARTEFKLNKRPGRPDVLELNFAFDSIVAEEKC